MRSLQGKSEQQLPRFLPMQLAKKLSFAGDGSLAANRLAGTLLAGSSGHLLPCQQPCVSCCRIQQAAAGSADKLMISLLLQWALSNQANTKQSLSGWHRHRPAATRVCVQPELMCVVSRRVQRVDPKDLPGMDAVAAAAAALPTLSFGAPAGESLRLKGHLAWQGINNGC